MGRDYKIMGYIAPITQFDYIQYANRTVEAGDKVRIVNGITPIQPIRFDQVLEDESRRLKNLDPVHLYNEERLNGASTHQNPLFMKVKDELRAKMTGKGGYFNEVI
jgi:hypothetical protein